MVCISFIKTIKVELNFSYANDDMKDSSQHALYLTLSISITTSESKDTAMQIEKAQINDRLRVLKVS